MIEKGAEPFFLRGSHKGVLLVHGFTGSPSEMIYWEIICINRDILF